MIIGIVAGVCRFIYTREVRVANWAMVVHGSVAALLLLLSGGCSTPLTSNADDSLLSWSVSERERIFPIFVNSPLDVAQIGRLADSASYFQARGFMRSDFLFNSSGSELATMTRDIRSRNPNARIALIGWSGASLWIWDALTELSQTGETVDLIVYLDSNWIKTRVAREGHPTNFRRAVLIYRRGNPPVVGVPGAVSRQVDTTLHLAVAAHEDTLEFLDEEFMRLMED